jgi:F-type H+-transporting ATPase subunit gamma
MIRLAEIESQIAGISELLDIVGAMRSLASMRVQEAHRALPGIRRYAETMAEAIGSALLLMPEPSLARGAARGPRAFILCTAEHGFVGGFNARFIDAAEGVLGVGDTLLVLGSRGAALTRERGWTPAWMHPTATRPDGVPEIIRQLTAQLYRLILRGHVAHVDLMFARHRQGVGTTIERRQLLPLDLAPAMSAGRRHFPRYEPRRARPRSRVHNPSRSCSCRENPPYLGYARRWL